MLQILFSMGLSIIKQYLVSNIPSLQSKSLHLDHLILFLNSSGYSLNKQHRDSIIAVATLRSEGAWSRHSNTIQNEPGSEQ